MYLRQGFFPLHPFAAMSRLFSSLVKIDVSFKERSLNSTQHLFCSIEVREGISPHLSNCYSLIPSASGRVSLLYPAAFAAALALEANPSSVLLLTCLINSFKDSLIVATIA